MFTHLGREQLQKQEQNVGHYEEISDKCIEVIKFVQRGKLFPKFL